MSRVISLIPSATEIVCALGLKDSLVGRSHECDYPSSIKKLPVCTEPSFDVTGTSREIDERVKSHLKNGLSIYKVNTDLIENLNPDVIITQSHCDVCAVSQKDIEKALGAKIGKGLRIVSLRPNELADLWGGITQVAEALGVAPAASQKISLYKSKMEKIRQHTQNLEPKPTVAAIEWIDPLMAAGNWVPELIEWAGGINLFGEAGRHSPWMKYEEMVKKNPDIILFMPCGFDIERTRDELEPFASNKAWFDLKAVQNNRVFLLDGKQYFNRPGPRLVESLEILAEIFHPGEFDFGHKNDGWQYWGFNRF